MISYKWLYSRPTYVPKVNLAKLEKYITSTFSRELGWEPQPNSCKSESRGNGNHGLLRFDEYRRRSDPLSTLNYSPYQIYGDSFALSRQVSSTETIAHLLGASLGQYLPNYGVGNYGLDQAFLRFNIRGDIHKIPIFIFVPETIARINTCWRHLHETGNTFAFKPRFFIDQGDLKLMSTPVHDLESFCKCYSNFQAGQHDFFDDPMYIYRFTKEVLSLKSILGLEPSAFVKLLELGQHLTVRMMNPSTCESRSLAIRMAFNSRFTDQLYATYATRTLFETLVTHISQSLDHNCYFFVLPQLSDLKVRTSYRRDVIHKLFAQGIKIFDFLDSPDARKVLLLSNSYVEDFHGGHLSYAGNMHVSSWIMEILRSI